MAHEDPAKQDSPVTHAAEVAQRERCPASLGPAGHANSAGDQGTNPETSENITQTTTPGPPNASRKAQA